MKHIESRKKLDNLREMKETNKDSVRSKVCNHCEQQIKVAFRIRIAPKKDWIFVCTPCCRKAGTLPGYQYGGTWKGRRK